MNESRADIKKRVRDEGEREKKISWSEDIAGKPHLFRLPGQLLFNRISYDP